MKDLRQAAQQALEALEKGETKLRWAAISALKQALAEPDSDYERGFVDGMNLQTKGGVDKAVNRMAQTTHWEGCEAVHPECRKPEQEPVGWQWLDTANYRKKLPANAIPEHWRPLFTAPTPRTWFGLTNEEIDVGLCRSPYALQTARAWRDGVEWAQAQLKEKNA